MKLWQKKDVLKKSMEAYTVGGDYLLDQALVPFDCEASMAHAKMLCEVGILDACERDQLIDGLKDIISLHEKGDFEIKQSDEDCHTAIENYLVKELGECGKKIHTARSRNDQVLTALRLYEKSMLLDVKERSVHLRDAFLKLAKEDCLLPGYTHMQPAMPSSLEDWANSFGDAISDNLISIDALIAVIDQSPLGTAAGYGVPVIDIKRDMTAKEMGFSRVQKSSIYAQHSRGKFDGMILSQCSSIMLDLNKMASDLLLFTMREFGVVELPGDFCTGSSIMPQKKNPDVLELMRAKYHVVIAHEFAVKGLSSNLISGYNRDQQLSKGPVMEGLEITLTSLIIASELISGVKFNSEKAQVLMREELYATEEAYELVKQGVPFREAYQKIGKKYS